MRIPKILIIMVLLTLGITTWLGNSGLVDYLATTTTTTSATTTVTTTQNKQLRGTFVLQLQGELGNHIAALANYYAVKTIASREFDLNLALHVRKQRLRRGAKQDYTAQHAKSCLVSFRELDFDECDWNVAVNASQPATNDGVNPVRGTVCDGRIARQSQFWEGRSKTNNDTLVEWASSLPLGVSSTNVGPSPDQIRDQLRNYAAMLRDPDIMDAYRHTEGLGWSDNNNDDESSHPFLYNIGLFHANQRLINEFWSPGLASYLAFDTNDTLCCDNMPAEDEHVFHFRSFKADLRDPRKLFGWGFAELRPEPAAELLAGTLARGSKVVIVSGRAVGNRTDMYREAFERRGFATREAPGQSGLQDFCFLSHVRASFWGVQKSTYATWSTLTNMHLRNATLYGVEYPSRTRKIPIEDIQPLDKDVAKVVHFPILFVKDEDVW